MMARVLSAGEKKLQLRKGENLNDPCDIGLELDVSEHSLGFKVRMQIDAGPIELSVQRLAGCGVSHTR